MKHLESVDGARALAALYVVCCHWLYLLTPVLPEIAHTWPGVLFCYSHLPVTVFIVISGYCLMLSVIRRGYQVGDLRTYILRRARRLLIPYAGALVFTLALIFLLLDTHTATEWRVTGPVSWWTVLTRVLLIQDIVDPAKINGPFWSLAVEWRCSLLFPLLVLCWRRFGPLFTVLGTVAISSLIAYFVLPVAYFAMPHYAGLFALGMLAAHVGQSPEMAPWRARLPFGAMGVVGVVAIPPLLRATGLLPGTIAPDLISGACAGCGLIALSGTSPSHLRQALSWRPLVILGGASYSLYLIHWPLEELCWRYLLAPWRLAAPLAFPLALFLGTTLICGVAYLFYLACERPILAHAQRTRPTPPASPLLQPEPAEQLPRTLVP